MTVQRLALPHGHGLKPWTPQPIDLVHFRLVPEHISITGYDDDGNLDYATQERFRVVGDGDDWIDVTDDWDEADRIMGIDMTEDADV